MKFSMFKYQKGFTLIEMVTVIVILGVLAVGTSSFLKFGTRIYAETGIREQILSSARFAIERLNREIRHAVPNSIYVDTSGAKNCLVFRPIIESIIYTEIPVSPEASSNTISVLALNNMPADSWEAIVYPLSTDDVYLSGNNKTHGVKRVTSSVSDVWEIELDSAVQFAADSPTKKIFFTNETVSYCKTGHLLTRNNILMARNLADELAYNAEVFEVLEATLTRNSMVQIHLKFEQAGEEVSFKNEIQIPNVP